MNQKSASFYNFVSTYRLTLCVHFVSGTSNLQINEPKEMCQSVLQVQEIIKVDGERTSVLQIVRFPFELRFSFL